MTTYSYNEFKDTYLMQLINCLAIIQAITEYGYLSEYKFMRRFKMKLKC